MSQQINLFNPIFLTQKKYFSAVTMLQALGLILLGSILMSIYVNFQLSRLRPEAGAVTAQLDAARAQLQVVNVTQGGRQKDGNLDTQVKRAEAELFALQRITHLLDQGEAGNASGYSEYMRAFSRQIVDGLWLTGFSIGGSNGEIDLSGGALRPELVPAYLSRLSDEPTMHKKAFETLEMTTGPSVQQSPEPFVTFRLQSSESTGTIDRASGGGIR